MNTNGIGDFKFDDQAMLRVAQALDQGSIQGCDQKDIHHAIEALIIVAGVVQHYEDGMLESLLDARVRRIQLAELADQLDCENETKSVIRAASNGRKEEKIAALIDLLVKAGGVSVAEATRILRDKGGYGDDDLWIKSRYYRFKLAKKQ